MYALHPENLSCVGIVGIGRNNKDLSNINFLDCCTFWRGDYFRTKEGVLMVKSTAMVVIYDSLYC